MSTRCPVLNYEGTLPVLMNHPSPRQFLLTVSNETNATLVQSGSWMDQTVTCNVAGQGYFGGSGYLQVKHNGGNLQMSITKSSGVYVCNCQYSLIVNGVDVETVNLETSDIPYAITRAAPYYRYRLNFGLVAYPQYGTTVGDWIKLSVNLV